MFFNRSVCITSSSCSRLCSPPPVAPNRNTHPTPHRWGSRAQKRAAIIALAVAAAVPLTSLRARAANELELNAAVDQALLLLAQDARMSDAQLLTAGADQFNRGQYEEAQTTLQQVKAESLPEADRAKLTETLAKVEAALKERRAARAEFETGEQMLTQGRGQDAIRHYRAAADSAYADEATKNKAMAQMAVAQASAGGAVEGRQDWRSVYKMAVADYKAKRFDDAKGKFQQLVEANYKPGLFDKKPKDFLRDIEKQAPMAAPPVMAQAQSDPAPAAQTTTETTVTRTETPAPAEPAPATTRSPKDAYEEGVAAYKRGDNATARMALQEAQAANYKPGLFKDPPARILRMIDEREARTTRTEVAMGQETGTGAGQTSVMAQQTPSQQTMTEQRTRMEIRTTEAQGFVEQAERAERANNPAQAYELFQRAAEADPNNQAARAGVQRTQNLAGGAVAPDSLINVEIQRNNIRKQAVQYSFNTAIDRARVSIASNDFVTAQEALQSARVARDSDPALFSRAELDTLNSTIATAQADLNAKQADVAAATAKGAREQAVATAAEQERIRLIEQRRTVQALVRTARQLTSDGNYEAALGVVNQILAIDPTNEYAIGVRELVFDYAIIQEQSKFRQRAVRQYQRQLNITEEMKIPYLDVLNFPENWPDISETRDRETAAERQGAGEDPQVLAQLERRLPEVRFEAVAFSDVIDFLRDVTGANVFVNWRALEAAGVERAAPVTARLRDVKFSKALELILRDVGGGAVPLGYTIDDGVITISTADELNQNVAIQVYDIRDLLVIAPDFDQPPDFQLDDNGSGRGGGGGGGGGGGRGGGGGGGGRGGGGGGGQNIFGLTQQGQQQQQTTSERVEELVTEISNLIRETVDRDSWIDNGGRVGSLRFLAGQLIVTQTPENQRALIGLLDKLRETRAIQVSIETRFLTVQRNFLEDIGFDVDFFFNIEDPDKWSPIAVQQNQTFTQGPVTQGPGSIAGSGATVAPSITLAGSFLDEFQVNFLIRATQASQNSTVVTAPRVTVFNSQRAFIIVGQQQAYVSDLEAVTAEGVVGFNPIVDTITSGVQLLVQPTVSADRKYVTLSLQPQLAQLIDLATFQLQGFGTGTGNPNVPGQTTVATASIQLPLLQITSVNTIVSVPDGGTLLLGGQTIAGETELEQGVPILSKIPIVKRLFTNKSFAKDEQILLILVKPTIIIQREVENQQFPLLNTRAVGSR